MIYLISGLGADERVFSKLNFGNHQTVFLPWLIPERNETMNDYLLRFSGSINQDEEIILLGVSFGGIVTVELAKLFPVKKIILISSIKTHIEFSFLLRFLKITKIYKLFPASKYKKNFRFLSHYYFGCETQEEKKALDDLIDDSDNRVIDWSVRTFFNWKNDQVPENLVHIHGMRDRIFPFRYLHHVVPVSTGTHYMIANKSDEVSNMIMQHLINNK